MGKFRSAGNDPLKSLPQYTGRERRFGRTLFSHNVRVMVFLVLV
jgi:hypothetical protein